MPKITVYMPNYNYGFYIKDSIESVIDQSLTDWELLIIDDGSKDNSIQIINEYKTHPKIKIIKQKNKGLNTTNNIAIRLSNSEYITRLDPDDYLDENFLLVLSKTLDKYPEYGLVYPDYYIVDKNNNILNIHIHPNISQKNSLKDLPAHGACTMFRKEILLNIGSYDEVFNCQDGYDIWLKFIQKYNPYNVNLPLFYYRQHEISLSKKKNKIHQTKIDITNKFSKKLIKNTFHSVLAVVPVTNKSLYEHNKPFTILNGKPLIYYTLSEIQKTKSVKNTIITTDDDLVVNYVRKNFSNFFAHKRKLKEENNLSNLIILNEIINLESHKNKFDILCMLYISTPLRKAKHIEYALSMMNIFQTDKLVSVSEELSQLYKHEVNGLKKINEVSDIIRFERNSVYKENGSIYIYKYDKLNKNEKDITTGHIKMLDEESIKINSKFDLFVAEQILKNNHL